MKLTWIANGFFSEYEYQQFSRQHAAALEMVAHNEYPSDMLDWVDIDRWAHSGLRMEIDLLAREIQAQAEVFVVVGLGGSNQGARAVIDALDHCRSGKYVEIIYAGLNLSAADYRRIINQIGNRSVYINIIAKNFKTLEPGVGFRVLRDYMQGRYTPAEAARRIVATATIGDGALHTIAKQQGYRCLPFPQTVGGRYSVFTPVGLLPIAVAGIDLGELLCGAREAMQSYKSGGVVAHNAKRYAIARNLLLEKGYDIEVLAFFEPALESLGRWWRQLFGESEGKNLTGIFPAVCSYSEDLHSMGQYMQQGKRHMMETFIWANQASHSLPLPQSRYQDGFEYLQGQTLEEINRCAYEATVSAHTQGGVPCMVLELPAITPYAIGELLYFFFVACYYSAVILGVDPFDQPGVENYKSEMFSLLRQGKE